MPNIAIDDNISITQIRAQWSVSFGSGESSWSFITPRAGGDARGLVLGMWEASCMASFAYGRHSSWLLGRVIAEDRWPGTHAGLIDDVNLAGDPLGEGNAMPPQCTPVISWRSGETGRSNRGRTYTGPYAVDSCDGTNVIGPADTGNSAFAEAMMATFTHLPPPTPLFSIVSRVPSPPLAPVGTYIPVIAYFYPARWGIERRRTEWDWRT